MKRLVRESCDSKKQEVESSVKGEKAYLVTYGQDSGGPESGPIISKGEYILLAESEEDACKQFEELYSPHISGYEGCWAREATDEEVAEWEDYMNEPEDLHFSSQKASKNEKIIASNIKHSISSYIDSYLDKCFFAEVRPEYDEAINYVANKVLEDLQNMTLSDIKYLVSKHVDRKDIRL